MSPSASYTHDTYLSPFTWRYGSDAMRRLWSEAAKRRLWRRIWVALASAQAEAGLVRPEQVADLRAHQDDIDWERAQELERDLRHDLMAEVRTYAEQCPVGGGIIHLGATSMDVEDNADALRLREALALVRTRLAEVLAAFAARIEAEADTVIMAYTHLQPAEPTTLGYRLSQYAQDFMMDLEALDQAAAGVRGKGFKGAVGTQASYEDLLAGTGMSPEELEARVMAALDLRAFPVATQTYPRKMDYTILNVLGGLAQSAYKFALDLRLLQSPSLARWPSPLAASRWARRPCPSSATRSPRRASARWPATWPACPGSPGTTPRTQPWSAPWMTRPTAARPCPRRSWPWMRCSGACSASWPGCASGVRQSPATCRPTVPLRPPSLS